MSENRQSNYLRVPKDSTTLRERTTDALRTAIFKMHLKPGQRLVESELCALTGVSRSSVREALRNLEAEGLVMPSTGRGMQVTPLTKEIAREIYDVRGVLEAAAGRSFAKSASSDDIHELKLAMARLRSTQKSPSRGEYVNALDEVYEVLLKGAKNQVAHQLVQTLNGRIHFLRALTSNVETEKRRQRTIFLMGEIVDAACQRKAKRTAKLCKAFVDRSAVFANKVLNETEAMSDAQAGSEVNVDGLYDV